MVKTIRKLERLPNSVNGNPRYRVWFTDDTVATTKPDAMMAFAISPAWEGREVRVIFQHRGKPGPLVIEDIEEQRRCRHCERCIVNKNGTWIDPEATGDDSIWRETCDSHDTFTAEHEP